MRPLGGVERSRHECILCPRGGDRATGPGLFTPVRLPLGNVELLDFPGQRLLLRVCRGRLLHGRHTSAGGISASRRRTHCGLSVGIIGACGRARRRIDGRHGGGAAPVRCRAACCRAGWRSSASTPSTAAGFSDALAPPRGRPATAPSRRRGDSPEPAVPRRNRARRAVRERPRRSQKSAGRRGPPPADQPLPPARERIESRRYSSPAGQAHRPTRKTRLPGPARGLPHRNLYLSKPRPRPRSKRSRPMSVPTADCFLSSPRDAASSPPLEPNPPEGSAPEESADP